jgi:hypothetical protein
MQSSKRRGTVNCASASQGFAEGRVYTKCRLATNRLAFGVWRLAFGVWRLAFGVRRSAFGVGTGKLGKT